MNVVELLGVAATFLIFVSLTQTNTIRLRAINTVGSIVFVVYGVLIGAFSVYLLNGVCAIVNVYKIVKELRGQKDDGSKEKRD